MAYGGASRFSKNDPFYYHLWCADGTERVERIPPGRIRPRSTSATCDDPPTEVDIPSSTSTDVDPPTSIDETHTPKKLTIATDNLICRFSGTHLTRLEDIVDGMERNSEPQHGLRASIDAAVQVQSQAQQQHSRELHESRVLVLYTGGTIGMCNRNGVYLPDQHYLPAAIRELPPLNDIDYVEEHYGHTHLKPYCLPAVRGVRKRVVYWLVEYDPLLDSSDMTFDDWIRIAHDIEKSYQAYDGFVILHGTDTLAYTACALSFMMENLGKPVVLTGAQIPVAEVRSDGLENMIGALIVAGSLDIPEVTVLFNNRLMRGNRSVKIDNFGLDAFNSPNMAPLATMDITINVNYESIFRSPDVAPFHVHGNLCRNVVVLRIFPSMPIESVQATLRPPTRGVVLQSFGSGNISMRRLDIIDEIARAVKRGCLVLNVSQCVKGRVDVNYESAQILSDAGVIAGSDMTTEAALTKLAYVLYKDEWDYETKTMMLKRNLRGELTVIHSEHLDEMDLISRLSKFLGVTSSAETRLLRNALFPPLVCSAAHANDVQLLEQLRVSGANVTSADYSQRTALHVAAAAGNRLAVEYLLRHAVNVHARDSAGENALTCAVRSRDIDVIGAIRRAGAQLIADPQRIGSELCLAAARHDLKALKAWHAAGANLGAADYGGRTALHVGCRNGDAAVVEFLCANGGGDAAARDHGGRSAVDEYRWAADRTSSAADVEVKVEKEEPPITMTQAFDNEGGNNANDGEAAVNAREHLRRIAHFLRMELPERKKIE